MRCPLRISRTSVKAFHLSLIHRDFIEASEETVPKARLLRTNFTAGELSPRLEGRPDLAKYFNGASTLENYLVYPQGGVYRAPGSRFVNEVKDSTKKTRLIPFVVNRTTAYVCEFGHLYIRFYKNGARIESPPGTPVEIASPYAETELFQIQYVQSVDVLFLDHPSHQTQKLSRGSDTSWALTNLALRPPAAFEDLTDISNGSVTLQPALPAGLGVNFTASAPVFFAGDVGRQIIYNTSRAVITGLGGASPNAVAVCDVLDDFPASVVAPNNINPAAIPSQKWFLNISPQSAIDTVSKSKPVGTQVTINFKNNVGGATQDTLRTAGSPLTSPEVGKFIKVLGGVIEIQSVSSTSQCKGIIRATLAKADKTKNPTGVEAGDWTLNVKSWDNAKGWPSAPMFFQGRLFHGGSAVAQPTTFWGSASDDYENYGVGSLADDALEYTIASRQFNKIQWLLDLGPMLIGTLGSVFSAKAPGNDQVLGGDVMPFVRATNTPGAAAIQPVTVGTRAIYIDSSQTQAIDLGYSFNDDTLTGEDLTLLADHIAGAGFAQEQIAYARNPNSILHFVRKDGQLACLTYYRLPENVVAWSHRATDGAFESVCAIPHHDGNRDQVWTIVNRTVNGATKRYVEYFEDGAAEFAVSLNWSSSTTYALNDAVFFAGVAYVSLQNSNSNHQPDGSPAWWQRARPWSDLHTDCAFVYTGAAATNVTGLAHVEGKTVDVVADGSYKGTRVVTGGQFDQPLAQPAAKIEIGLHYDSKLVTMRPALQDSMIEGTRKMWDKLTVRLLNSIGCRVNGNDVLANTGGEPMDIAPPLFSGDKPVPCAGWDDQGRITIEQKSPYPQIVLAVYGRLNLSSLD
jgi:hypothetical protein